MRTLVIEDYLPTLNSIRKELTAEGMQVDSTVDGKEGLWFAQNNKYDVIILDVMLPGMSGLSILEQLKNRERDTQIILLTARDGVEDRVKGLDLGADDYLVKPFAMEELMARVRALGRRATGHKNPVIELQNGLSLDTARRDIRLNGAPIELTPREYALLHFLVRHRDTVVSRNAVWEGIYEFHSNASSNVVDVYIARLRRKLRTAGQTPIIKTRRGEGYILESTLNWTPEC